MFRYFFTIGALFLKEIRFSFLRIQLHCTITHCTIAKRCDLLESTDLFVQRNALLHVTIYRSTYCSFQETANYSLS